MRNFIKIYIKQLMLKIIISKKFGIYLPNRVIVTRQTQLADNVVINENCNISGSHIGLGTFIASDSALVRAKVGKFCSIGQNVQTRFGIHPSSKFVSTHPAFFSKNKQAGFTFVQKQRFEEHRYIDEKKEFFVGIGNDVWVGNDVRIMDGVSIGDGAIVGLGSVVTKDIEPYSINAGVPAGKIGYRFNEDQRRFLLKFKWWERDFDWIKENGVFFDNIETFINRNKN